MSSLNSFFERKFKLKEHGTTTKTEILAGITTFMTMAYILAVNPGILSEAGMDASAVFSATVIASVVATLIMALYANLPFALAPGMGLNAFFAYTVVITMGYSWQMALTAVFLEGIIFIILTALNVREAIINCIPMNIKKAISVGIGLFIAFIGLSNAGIVAVGQGTPLMLGNMHSPAVILACIGIMITGILLAYDVKGAIFYGILITTAIGIPMGVTNLPSKLFQMPAKPLLFKLEFPDLTNLENIKMLAKVLFIFLFVDMFDTVGTLIGVSTKASMLTEDGRVPNVKKALFADAIGTTLGACLGTSTVTTFVESASGVAEGGRTGLTALSTSVMFILALFLSPLFISIPPAATAPALIIVGLFMMSPIQEIDFNDYTEAIPAFVTLLMMPLAYSIAEGIVYGIISYVILKVATGKFEDIPVLTYIVALVFIIQIIIG